MQVLFTILTCGWIILCDILYSYKAFLMTEWNNWMKQLNEWMNEWNNWMNEWMNEGNCRSNKRKGTPIKKTKLEKEWTFHKCNRSIRLFLYLYIYICMHTHNTFILFPLSLNVWFIYYENQNHNSNPVHTEIIKPDHQQQQQQQIYLVS